MRAGLKLLRAVLHLLRGFWIIRTQFSRLTQHQREQKVKRWSAGLLKILGVRLVISGTPQSSGLLVANHLSWLDITVIHSAHFCRFIAKSDIRAWPLIGYLTHQSGMLFVQRTKRKDAHRVVRLVAEQLRQGDCIALFPEGTTSDGEQLLPFHANLFQSAIEAQVPVQALAIRYVDKASGKVSQAPLYVGDDTLLTSVWRVLSAQPICAQLTFCEPDMDKGRDRRTFAADTRSQVQQALTLESV
jgi:1-acyl-sn-glycerol-3-phosphate acyltransferase